MTVTEERGVIALRGRVAISDRIERLRESILSGPVQATAERSHLITEYYKHTDSDYEPATVRRARAYKYVLEKMTIAIRDDELIVGNLTDLVRGCSFYPEHSCAWIVEELGMLSTREVEQRYISEEDKKLVLEDVKYWLGRSLQDRLEALLQDQYGTRIQDAVEAKLFFDTSGLPIGRTNLDYAKALNNGLSGVIEEAHQELAKIRVSSFEDLQRRYALQAMVIACEGVISFAQRHETLARELASKEKNPIRKQELEEIAEVCARVPADPARTFREALQSFWFVHLCRELEAPGAGHTPGRFDQYMYPFYKNDMNKGKLTREQALGLIGHLWIKFNQINRVQRLFYGQNSLSSMFQNVTIGGQTTEGKSAVNELSYLILDVHERIRFPQPTISLRYFDGLEDEFLLRAAEVVRTGGGMPAWFNDKYALTVLPYYGVSSIKEARNWAPVGCVEIGIPGSSALFYGFGFINVAKCLELALNNGVDPRTKKQVGLATGEARVFKTYDELLVAVKKQLSWAIETALLAYNAFYAMSAAFFPVPFGSALMNDCIKKGKDMMEGGIKYNSFIIMQPVGFVNTANSLYAVKKLVYEDKAISMEELLDALAVDFQGKEEFRNKLVAAPKYGNDIDDVDQVLSDLYQFVIREANQYRGPFGDPVFTAFLGVGMHYAIGSAVGALPDGRKAYTPMADGSLSAFPGTDVNGPTALLMSASKVDPMPASSTLLNLKIHPTAIKSREGLKKLIQLVKTYFDLYGYHIQFNVVSRETLIDAKKNPHLHRDLLVRVAGFSVFWVELPPAVQDEILARTEYSF